MRKFLSLDEQKSEIIYYLEKYPFSTITEVAYGLRFIGSKFYSIKKAIKILLEEGKIGNIPEVSSSYFVMPSQSEGPDKLYLIQLMSSEKIFLPRFQKLEFKKFPDSWNVPQLIKTLICVFYLQLKIYVFHKRREYEKEGRKFSLNAEFMVNFRRKFLRELISYESPISIKSSDDLMYAYKIGFKKDFETYYHNFIVLKSSRIPLEELIPLMTTKESSGSYREAADKHGTTVKNIRILLKSITDDQGDFSYDKFLEHPETGWDDSKEDIVPDITKLLRKKKKTKSSA